MEAVGSRLGRTSSRYGPGPTIFSGRVRKWRKKWVNVSTRPTASYRSSQSNGRGGAAQNSTASSHLVLCRWTPLSSSTAEGNGSGGTEEQPARRRFRYTPIAVLEERQKDTAIKAEEEVEMEKEINQFEASELNMKGETQDLNVSQMDLGLQLKAHNNAL